jgi:hypothetical protein
VDQAIAVLACQQAYKVLALTSLPSITQSTVQTLKETFRFGNGNSASFRASTRQDDAKRFLWQEMWVAIALCVHEPECSRNILESMFSDYAPSCNRVLLRNESRTVPNPSPYADLCFIGDNVLAALALEVYSHIDPRPITGAANFQNTVSQFIQNIVTAQKGDADDPLLLPFLEGRPDVTYWANTEFLFSTLHSFGDFHDSKLFTNC